ncbi:MAG: endopeptidase La, partial [Bacteriovoracia bacterium]
GKTSVGHSIARSLNRNFYRFSVGGMRDEAEIKGHRRTYIGAMPGKFVQALKSSGSCNPVIMLDEVDKIGASYQGDPASALLEVLDPEQNSSFLDHYLDVRFDLSEILFICTANQLETIPGPLKDRMEIIHLAGYILDEKIHIARRHLMPKLLKQHGLKGEQVQLSDAVLKEVIDGHAREAGVRSLEKLLSKIMRKGTKKMLEEDLNKIVVTKQNLNDFIGKKTFREEDVYTSLPPGVATGLAYTPLGGATLYIETSKVMSKSGGYKQTGQLGKVMVESCDIAYTFIRSLLHTEEFKNFFEENFIHIHVPAGATPKDGPSAGITIAAALYSLATDLPLKKNLAMTGELSLTGKIMPIGGIKEKTIAAKRAGICNLIFPEANREDFDDLDESIKEGIRPYFVGEFDQVLKVCFQESVGHKIRKLADW